MIELKNDALVFSFPEVHPAAELTIEFQRTLRIPDDGKHYPLPPGLGAFPLRHVDDYAAGLPSEWLEHGGIMMPMYQSEAMWLRFRTAEIEGHDSAWPFAIKVATGKQCAVSGAGWKDGIARNPQNYLVAPKQPWLDGYVVEKDCIRQFVAMPLGAGYTAEEQITGRAEHGGLQLAVYPMKREVFERRFPKREVSEALMSTGENIMLHSLALQKVSSAGMGLAPGGRMKQRIEQDPFEIGDWDTTSSSRCFVHLCNSMVWNSITGTQPPYPPLTAKQYTASGLPWFDWYDETGTALEPTETLKSLKSIVELSAEKNTVVLPENESVNPRNIITYRPNLKPNQVREGSF